MPLRPRGGPVARWSRLRSANSEEVFYRIDARSGRTSRQPGATFPPGQNSYPEFPPDSSRSSSAQIRASSASISVRGATNGWPSSGRARRRPERSRMASRTCSGQASSVAIRSNRPESGLVTAVSLLVRAAPVAALASSPARSVDPGCKRRPRPPPPGSRTASRRQPDGGTIRRPSRGSPAPADSSGWAIKVRGNQRQVPAAGRSRRAR